jgi:Ribbon-helix-helix protein, copG family
MPLTNRNSARVTVNMTQTQRAELERIAARSGVSLSWVIRRSLERTVEEANGGPLLPLDLSGERSHDA